MLTKRGMGKLLNIERVLIRWQGISAQHGRAPKKLVAHPVGLNPIPPTVTASTNREFTISIDQPTTADALNEQLPLRKHVGNGKFGPHLHCLALYLFVNDRFMLRLPLEHRVFLLLDMEVPTGGHVTRIPSIYRLLRKISAARSINYKPYLMCCTQIVNGFYHSSASANRGQTDMSYDLDDSERNSINATYIPWVLAVFVYKGTGNLR